jgi:hypothetical protein
VQQVGEKGTPSAERFATDKGVQSIDKHAGSTGQQPTVEDSSLHWQCSGYHIDITLDSSQQWRKAAYTDTTLTSGWTAASTNTAEKGPSSELGGSVLLGRPTTNSAATHRRAIHWWSRAGAIGASQVQTAAERRMGSESIAMTADRQSGLTQQPPSEQNGADAELLAEA